MFDRGVFAQKLRCFINRRQPAIKAGDIAIEAQTVTRAGQIEPQTGKTRHRERLCQQPPPLPDGKFLEAPWRNHQNADGAARRVQKSGTPVKSHGDTAFTVKNPGFRHWRGGICMKWHHFAKI